MKKHMTGKVAVKTNYIRKIYALKQLKPPPLSDFIYVLPNIYFVLTFNNKTMIY